MGCLFSGSYGFTFLFMLVSVVMHLKTFLVHTFLLLKPTSSMHDSYLTGKAIAVIRVSVDSLGRNRPLQHWIPEEFSLLSLKRGVWVMSWSTNWPHCITLWVSSSLGASTSGIMLMDTSLAEGRASPDLATFGRHIPSLYSGSRVS